MNNYYGVGSVVAVLMVLCIASSTNGTELGAKVGPTVADHRTDANMASDARVGLRIDLYARWAISSRFNLTGAIGYTQRGARNVRILSDEPNPDLGADHRLHYITIPILADIGYEVGPVALFGGGGPRVDVLINNGVNVDAAGRYFSEFGPLVLGAVAVGGVRSIENRVSLEVQYNWDITNSYSGSSADYFRNQAFDVLIGFAF